MRASVAYSLARLGVFAACLGIGWLVGLRDPLVLLLIAATVSMLLSLLFLAKLRDRFSVDVANRIEGRRSRRHPEATGRRPGHTAPTTDSGRGAPAASDPAASDPAADDADSFR